MVAKTPKSKAPPPSADELARQLDVLLKDLSFVSEDGLGATAGATLWRPGKQASQDLSPDEFAKFIGLDSSDSCDIDEGGLSGLLKRAETNDAKHLKTLVKLMEGNLDGLNVYRVVDAENSGPIFNSIDCYACGRHSSTEVLGFTTTLVEPVDA